MSSSRGVTKRGGPTKLQCVTIVTGHLNWGCMVGQCDGRQVTVQICEHRRQRLIGGWPVRGDILGCELLHDSVFEPRLLLKGEDLRLTRLLRQKLPVCAETRYCTATVALHFTSVLCLQYDLTDDYFCIRRPLVRVDERTYERQR